MLFILEVQLKTSRFHNLLFLLAVCAALVTSSLLSFAQSTRGTVTGTVTDQTGAVIQNATVVLLAPATDVSFTTKTNKAGVYRFDSVAVGDYTITISAQGFLKVSTPATVTVGALVGRDVTLRPGDSVSVEVVNTAPELQTEDAVRSKVINSKSLAEIPISGQNSLNLMLLAPGVAPSQTLSSSDSGIGAVNGARARSNNFILDGINNNDISVTGPQFSFTNNDALQEVSVQTSNFSAEFGRAGGAVISQVLRSGTNAFHGTAAHVYRSNVFTASTQKQRNAWRNAGGDVPGNILVPKFVENIPAFTVGGPIFIPHLYDGRSKTFFFAAGQWDLYNSGGTQSTFTVPTAAGYQTLSNLANSCSNVKDYLAQLGSARGSSGIGSNSIPIEVQPNLATTTCNGNARTGQVVEVGTYVRTVAEKVRDNNHLIKIDHKASEKQTMTFRWLWDSNSDNAGGNIGITPQFDVPFKATYLSAAFNDTYTLNPRLVNEFRFGFSRNNYGWFIGNGIASTSPAITVAGISTLALSSSYPQGRVSNTWQYSDSITYLNGKHAIKIGADFMRQLAVQVAPYNSRGAITYASNTTNDVISNPISALANYIDNFGGAGGSSAVNFGSGRYRPNLFTLSLYVQDTYKVTNDLTLNLGLRYENFGQPANIFKYAAVSGPDMAYDAAVKANHDNNNFGPSIGFAYSPGYLSHNRSFVIRGGYQISYDTFFNNLLSNMAAATPNTQSSQPIASASDKTTPRGYVGLSGVLPKLTAVPLNPYLSYQNQFEKYIANPLTHHISFGIQKQLPGGIFLDVAYVGTLGRQIFTNNVLNPAVPNATFTSTATQTTPYGTATKRLNPNRGLITTRESGATSSYNGLQVQVQRANIRTEAGAFTVSTNYTWSRSMDPISEVFSTYQSGAYPSKSAIQWGPVKKWDWGPSDFDRRQISNTLVQWDIRGTRSHDVLNHIVGGWSVTPILQVTSGSPFTITNYTDRDLDGVSSNDRPNYGNPKAPINSRAVITSTSNCSTGYYDPNRRTTTATPISAACVDPANVRWIQAPVYQPTSSNMVKRNSVYATRYLNLDANLLKKFVVVEGKTLELRGEFFNLTNTQSFAYGNAENRAGYTSNTFLDFGLVDGGNRRFRVGAKFIF